MGKKKYSSKDMRAMQYFFWNKIDSIKKSDLILSSRLYVRRREDTEYDNLIMWDRNKHDIIRIGRNEDNDRYEHGKEE